LRISQRISQRDLQ